jgi:hypothetical protein
LLSQHTLLPSYNAAPKCTDCVELANRRRPSFQDDWIFEQDEARHADRIALEARHATAHGDDTEEELSARLTELRSSPGTAAYGHERIMVELHLHRLSEQIGLTDDNGTTGEVDSHYAEWLALEARYTDAHGDDTEEEVNVRLAELHLSPDAEEFDGEKEMVTLHSPKFSDLL